MASGSSTPSYISLGGNCWAPGHGGEWETEEEAEQEVRSRQGQVSRGRVSGRRSFIHLFIPPWGLPVRARHCPRGWGHRIRKAIRPCPSGRDGVRQQAGQDIGGGGPGGTEGTAGKGAHAQRRICICSANIYRRMRDMRTRSGQCRPLGAVGTPQRQQERQGSGRPEPPGSSSRDQAVLEGTGEKG